MLAVLNRILIQGRPLCDVHSIDGEQRKSRERHGTLYCFRNLIFHSSEILLPFACPPVLPLLSSSIVSSFLPWRPLDPSFSLPMKTADVWARFILPSSLLESCNDPLSRTREEPVREKATFHYPGNLSRIIDRDNGDGVNSIGPFSTRNPYYVYMPLISSLRNNSSIERAITDYCQVIWSCYLWKRVVINRVVHFREYGSRCGNSSLYALRGLPEDLYRLMP